MLPVIYLGLINVIGPFLSAGASNFTEAMKMGSETYHHLKNVIKAKYGQDGKVTFSK